MSPSKFIKTLDAEGYAFHLEDEKVVVTESGFVDLPRLTTLSEGVTFKNRGYVDLRCLTTLPEGVTFENGGSVYLTSLTSMPESVTFENGGSVDLTSLTSMPEGVTFENGGYVDLRGLSGDHFYKGKLRRFCYVDGMTMLIKRSKTHGDYVVHEARYFGGGDISKLPSCYIAERDECFAHGKTVKEAIEDLQYKLNQDADKKAVAADIVSTGRVTLNQFHQITGACREGVRQHLSERGIDLDSIENMAIDEAMEAMQGTSFGETFKRYVKI